MASISIVLKIQFILLAAAAIRPAIRHASFSKESGLLSNTLLIYPKIENTLGKLRIKLGRRFSLE